MKGIWENEKIGGGYGGGVENIAQVQLQRKKCI